MRCGLNAALGEKAFQSRLGKEALAPGGRDGFDAVGGSEEHAEGEGAGAVVTTGHGVFDAGGGEVLAVMTDEPQNSGQCLRDRAGATELADGIALGGSFGGLQSPCGGGGGDDALQFAAM